VIDPTKLGPGFYPTPKAPEAKVNSFGKDTWFGYVERELKKVPQVSVFGPDVNEQTFVKKTFNMTVENVINGV